MNCESGSAGGELIAGVFIVGALVDILAVAALGAVVAPIFAIVFGVLFYAGLAATIVFGGAHIMYWVTHRSLYINVADALEPIADVFAGVLGVLLYMVGLGLLGIGLFTGGIWLLGKMM